MVLYFFWKEGRKRVKYVVKQEKIEEETEKGLKEPVGTYKPFILLW